MKKISILLLAAIHAIPTFMMAQKIPVVFHSVNESSSTKMTEIAAGYNTLSNDSDSVVPFDSVSATPNPYSGLSTCEIERMIKEYEVRVNKRNDAERLSFYTGSSHELNMDNLILVVGEVGLSNQLFVLAQAVLETGYFSSNVCKKYNNLFGLYNSRKHEYYKFERWEDSVIGYQRFIQYRYKGGNYLAFLKKIGYAEDPRYISKVAKIARKLYHKLFSS